MDFINWLADHSHFGIALFAAGLFVYDRLMLVKPMKEDVAELKKIVQTLSLNLASLNASFDTYQRFQVPRSPYDNVNHKRQ